jgi:hypothetical protein
VEAGTCRSDQYLKGCTVSNAGTCVSCKHTTHGYGDGCSSCDGSACLGRDCSTSGADTCGTGYYLSGCTTTSAGVCVACEETHGMGCSSCTSSSCSARDCSRSGANTCSDSRYLSGCTTSSEGTCVSCAATYGLGCANCTINVCLDRNCDTSTRTTSSGDIVAGADICTANQFLDGCSAQSKGTCISCAISHGEDCTGCSGGGDGDCVTRACTTAVCLGCANDYDVGCTNCTGTAGSSGECTARDCEDVAQKTCSRNQYLLGCVTLSAGACTDCDADSYNGGFGAGCSRCSETECLDRDCPGLAAVGGGHALALCSSSQYL